MLALQIDGKLPQPDGLAVTNFAAADDRRRYRCLLRWPPL